MLFGYRHCGREVYIDRNGMIRRLNLIMRRRDRWRGFLGGLGKWKIDHFSDHSIHQYIDALAKAMRAEDQLLSEGKAPLDVEKLAGPDKHQN